MRLLASLLTVVGLWNPVTGRATETPISTVGQGLGQVAEALAFGQDFPRESPFVRRPFVPELDGRWIGNGVAYGCFRRGQAPGGVGPTMDELLEDLRIISGHWQLIRLYNADDQAEQILSLVREHKLPIRVMLGIWLAREDGDEAARAANSANVLRALQLAQRYPEAVACICVGNETQVDWSAHRMDASQLVRYLRTVRQHTQLPVTTADDYGYWVTEGSLPIAAETDFITTHAHPLWNGQSLEGAIAWIDATLGHVQERHPSTPLVLGETGWATSYDPTRTGPGAQGTVIHGEVGVEAQGRFLAQFNNWIKGNPMPAFWFEVFDEPWKGGGDATGPADVEKNWGLFDEFRQPKASFLPYTATTKGQKADPAPNHTSSPHMEEK